MLSTARSRENESYLVFITWTLVLVLASESGPIQAASNQSVGQLDEAHRETFYGFSWATNK